MHSLRGHVSWQVVFQLRARQVLLGSYQVQERVAIRLLKKNTSRPILKFFFHSLSGKIPLYELNHHWSALPEFLYTLPRRYTNLLRTRRSLAAALYCCID